MRSISAFTGSSVVSRASVCPVHIPAVLRSPLAALMPQVLFGAASESLALVVVLLDGRTVMGPSWTAPSVKQVTWHLLNMGRGLSQLHYRNGYIQVQVKNTGVNKSPGRHQSKGLNKYCAYVLCTEPLSSLIQWTTAGLIRGFCVGSAVIRAENTKDWLGNSAVASWWAVLWCRWQSQRILRTEAQRPGGRCRSFCTPARSHQLTATCKWRQFSLREQLRLHLIAFLFTYGI